MKFERRIGATQDEKIVRNCRVEALENRAIILSVSAGTVAVVIGVE